MDGSALTYDNFIGWRSSKTNVSYEVTTYEPQPGYTSTTYETQPEPTAETEPGYTPTFEVVSPTTFPSVDAAVAECVNMSAYCVDIDVVDGFWTCRPCTESMRYVCKMVAGQETFIFK